MRPGVNRAIRGARRAWPFVLMGWRRWQELPPERREAYKQRAKGYADQGRKALKQRKQKRGR